MAQISPFQAWRYAPEHVSVSRVVTQPYDKITPEMQEAYYSASPYNLVRIILGKHLPGDDERNSVYTRAVASFQEWRQKGVVRPDPEPSLYSYSQTFALPGGSERAERRGFIGLGRIEDYSAQVIFRHELTHSKPKADRLNLLRSTRAHFGQIFMLYNGTGASDALLRSSAAPDIEVRDEYGVEHRVWRISDRAIIAQVQHEMRDQKLVIADGHHRYETALNYRNECQASAGSTNGPAAYDWVMMTFVDMNSPGLTILPTHRSVFGLPDFSADKLKSGAEQFFTVDELEGKMDAARATAILKKAGTNRTALLAVTAQRVLLLHTPKAQGTALFSGLSPRQQSLDVVQLHKCVIEGVLRVSEESVRNLENVSYYREPEAALAQVHAGKAQAAFLMNPVRIEQMRDIALAGEVMPQKSTDFYPKLLSGLTIYALE